MTCNLIFAVSGEVAITPRVEHYGKRGPAWQAAYSASNNWGDVVQGGRFALNITPRVGALFLGDAGGGGSVLTWQIAGRVGSMEQAVVDGHWLLPSVFQPSDW